MHERLYGRKQSAIKEGRFTGLDEEFHKLSSSIISTKGLIRADVTVVPFSVRKVSREDIVKNLSNVFSTKLYHLCMSMYKKSKIDSVQDEIIKGQIEELVKAGSHLNKMVSNEDASASIPTAALACTHVVVKTIFSDLHHLETIHGADLDTQAVSTYLTMALTGNVEFRDFAVKIGLIDFSSQLVEDLNSGKFDALYGSNLHKLG